MQDLKKILENYDPYQRIHASEKVAYLLPFYLNGASERTAKGDINQGDAVLKMMGQDDLSSISVIYHEKWEIAGYINRGCSDDDIKNWNAHNKFYLASHNDAERIELNLIQHVGNEVLGITLPLHVLFPTRPAMEMFCENPGQPLNEHHYRMQKYHTQNTQFGLTMGFETFVPLEFNPEDVKTCFELFEMFGSTYSEEFKRATMKKVEDFTKRTNTEYKKAEQDGLEKKEEERKKRLANQTSPWGTKYSVPSTTGKKTRNIFSNKPNTASQTRTDNFDINYF
jgi:hypothetical protein